MRLLSAVIAFSALACTPAMANGIDVMPGRIVGYATTDLGGAGVPTVNRGDLFAISCDNIRAAGSDVRVVMSLATGEQPTGYSAVLATNQSVARHAVHVQVPDVPDIANHTVNVKVYVTDAKGTKACDAGRVHIV
jgi:hypothetical protein